MYFIIYHMTEIDQVIRDLKSFAGEYIVYDSPQNSIVKRGMRLMKRTRRLEKKHCCASYVSNHKWCELEYWSEIVRLICHRIGSLNKTRRLKSTCESYSSFRYEYIGLPTIMHPSGASSVIKVLTLFFLAISALIQLLRLQLVDGQVSFWSQIAALLGSIVTVIYFISIGNFDLAFPYIGGCLVTSITIWGIFMHDDQPWTSL